MTKPILTKEQVKHIQENIKLYVSGNIYGYDVITSNWSLKGKIREIEECKVLQFSQASFDVKINGKVYHIDCLRAELVNNNAWIDWQYSGLTDNARWKLHQEIAPIFAEEFRKLDKHKKVVYNKFIRNFKETYKELQVKMKEQQKYLKEYELEV